MRALYLQMTALSNCTFITWFPIG